MDGGCVDDGVDAGGDIFRPLADGDDGSERAKTVYEGRAAGIRTGYREACAEKDLGEAAHTDAPDADKMYMFRFVKIYAIHI